MNKKVVLAIFARHLRRGFCTQSMDYEGFLSRAAKRSKPNRLRELINHTRGDLLNLTGGLPNEKSFLLENMQLTLTDGTEIRINRSELVSAQQYWPTAGLDKYSKLIYSLVKKRHNPPCWNKTHEEGKTIVWPSCGGTDYCNQIINLVMDIGDTIIVEEYSYPGINTLITCNELKPHTVAIDKDGMVIESLRSVLSKWDPLAAPGSTDKPKMMCVIPHGQNPTGITYSLERKQQIYKVAQEYNILIFEDDPYQQTAFEKVTPSFLSLDTDGRVLRGDSFSKTLGPGFRAGYITGPQPLMKTISEKVSLTTYGTGAMSQTVITSIIDKLTLDGYLEHSRRCAQIYKNQRDLIVHYVDKWLKGLVDYDIPNSGMFLWLRVRGVTDTRDLIFNNAVVAGVLVVPGELFSPIQGRDSPYIRVSFSRNTEQEFDKALQLLAEVIRNYVVEKQNRPKDFC